jgi:hypothetical protein
MFRAVLCLSSGGHIVLLQHLVSSLSVNGRRVRRLRADSVANWNKSILWCTVRKTSKYLTSVVLGCIILFFHNNSAEPFKIFSCTSNALKKAKGILRNALLLHRFLIHQDLIVLLSSCHWILGTFTQSWIPCALNMYNIYILTF